MTDSNMDIWKEKRKRSDEHIRTAERCLESGDGLNVVPDEISWAIYNAMEGWLRHNNIKPDFSYGMGSLSAQYHEECGKQASEAGYLLTGLIFLENDLLGTAETPGSLNGNIDEWKENTAKYLDRAKLLIDSIEKELSG